MRDHARMAGWDSVGRAVSRSRTTTCAAVVVAGVGWLTGCADVGDEPSDVATETIGTDATSVPGTDPTGTTAPDVTDPNTVLIVTLPPTTEATPPSGPPPVAVEALARLDAVWIADPDPSRPPYVRDEYQPGGWPDLDGDCVSTRHQVLAEQSEIPVTWSADGCFVQTGRWTDPYTGASLTSADEATIDHLIPLAEGHRSGAWAWDVDTKIRFTNDLSPGALLVVSSEVNQSKADKTPDQWMPPLASAHCAYAIDWIDKKARWGLTMTQAEYDTVKFVTASCTSETAPVAAPGERAVVNITVPTTTTTTTIAPTTGPAEVVLVSCERFGEEVVIANRGGQPADLSGFRLHDEGDKHSTPLGAWGPLAPGATLTIVTGDEATDGPNRVVWKRQNVWNNDGDTAYLVGAGGVQTRGC